MNPYEPDGYEVEDDWRYWQAKTAKELREEIGASVHDVAMLSGEQTAVVHRFEALVSRPRYPTRLLAAYAYLAGIEDVRDMFELVINRWREENEAIADPEASARIRLYEARKA